MLLRAATEPLEPTNNIPTTATPRNSKYFVSIRERQFPTVVRQPRRQRQKGKQDEGVYQMPDRPKRTCGRQGLGCISRQHKARTNESLSNNENE